MLLFLDGCAHYDTTRIGHKYTAVDATDTTWTVASAEGRFGNAIKRVSTSNTAVAGYLDLAPLTTRVGAWTPTASGVCGFALKIDDLTRLAAPDEDGVTTASLFAILQSGNFHLKVAINPSGTFSLVRQAGPLDVYGYVEAISTEGLTSNTWMYVEFKWLIHPSAGTFAIRVNGVPVLDFTGATQSTNPAWTSLSRWNSVRLLHLASELAPYLTVRYCDLYLADLASAVAADVSDFLGDGIIETIMPNGAGSSTGWTPEPLVTPNWDTTNDLPAPDDDTTYVEATAVDTVDTYQFEDVPVTAVIKAAHVCILARKETEGSSSIAPVVHQGSTDYVGPTQGVASTAYDRYLTQAYDLNPATLAKFTAAEINAGQFGVKKIS